MPAVEEGIQSQLRNIEKAYGRTIDELVAIVRESGLVKHSEVVAMLKHRYGLAHGQHIAWLWSRGAVWRSRPRGAAPRLCHL